MLCVCVCDCVCVCVCVCMPLLLDLLRLPLLAIRCAPGAKIQILDLPGIIEGAKDGKGRGKQVIGTARTCNVICVVLDATRCVLASVPRTCLCCCCDGPIRQSFTASVTQACARRPGAAESLSRRRRERRTLLAGGGKRANRSHSLAASQALSACERFFHRVKT